MKTTLFTEGVITALSPLEKDVITKMQPQQKYGATEIYTALKKKKKVAPSSVSVILDRLYQKGLVRRETETARGGIRFLYALETNQEKFERSVVESTVNQLVKKFGSKAVAYFNESFKMNENRKSESRKREERKSGVRQ